MRIAIPPTLPRGREPAPGPGAAAPLPRLLRALLGGQAGPVLALGSPHELWCEAYRSLGHEITVVSGAGTEEALAWAAGSFGIVHAHFLLQRLPRPERALSEWIRVLQTGGRLVVTDAFRPAHLGSRLRSALQRGRLRPRTTRFPEGLRRRETEALLRVADLSPVSSCALEPSLPQPRPPFAWLRRGGEAYVVAGRKR